LACNRHHKLTTIVLRRESPLLGMSSNVLPFPVKLRWNYTSGTADLLSIYFSAVRLIGARFRLLCERLHSSIYFWVVRLRFVQVGFICVWFDSFLRRSIYFLAVRSIFVQSAFICMWFDLFLRDSIEFLLFWHYVDDLCFIWARLIMFVRVSYCLFWTLDILAVTERHKLVGVLPNMENSAPSWKIFRTKFLTSSLHNGRYWQVSGAVSH